MLDLVERITAYWQWADASIWSIVKNLTEEEFSKRFGEFGPSIRQRYIHLAEDSWEWYADWTGADTQDEPDFDTMSNEELFDFISSYNKKWSDLRMTDSGKTINVGSDEKMFTLTLPEILFHMNNHATYHRGQIVMSLRMLGKETHMSDYVPHRLETL